MTNTEPALDRREQLFVDEYLVDLDPKRAALAAGYSESMAASKAYQWVSNSKVKPHVFAAIEAAQKTRAERTQITQDRVLQELAKIGFSDIRGLLTPMGNLKSVEDWGDDIAGAVSSIEVVTKPGDVDEDGNRTVEHVHKLKVWDKNSALEKIAKHLGMFVERHEHSGPGGGPLDVKSTALERLESRIAGLASDVGAGRPSEGSDA